MSGEMPLLPGLAGRGGLGIPGAWVPHGLWVGDGSSVPHRP